jgi:DNA-binding transcriptional regulator YiaG
MGAIWSFIVETKFQHPPATAILLVAGLFLCGTLALRVVALFLTFWLSRRAIERGYPIEASSGREFYFKISPGSQAVLRHSIIRKPRNTASGARLRAIRSERSLTLAELSTATSISASRLSALETGRAQIFGSDIDVIAKILQLTGETSRDLKRLAKSDASMFEDDK